MAGMNNEGVGLADRLKSSPSDTIIINSLCSPLLSKGNCGNIESETRRGAENDYS